MPRISVDKMGYTRQKYEISIEPTKLLSNGTHIKMTEYSSFQPNLNAEITKNHIHSHRYPIEIVWLDAVIHILAFHDCFRYRIHIHCIWDSFYIP